MTDYNYFQINPSFDVYANYPIDGQARSQDVALRGASRDEAEVFQKFFLRTGAIQVKVIRHDPFQSHDTLAPFGFVVPDDELTCLDCGGDIYKPGAPAICAAGHKCRHCDKTWVKCQCPNSTGRND